ncbi:MAG: fused MFS/spermidine synthase [Vicinamibacterales bacterium]
MVARGVLYFAFACSGAAALIYETTWTRLLTLFMGHTVAAASTVLAAFMGGLAIGAALAGRLAPRLGRATALRGYAAIEILIAVAAMALPFALSLLEPIVAWAYADGDGGALFALVRLLCALLIVTLPAIAMGATLPLAIRWLAGPAERAGRDTGLLYAANTVGAALGAVVSGFVLLPALGIRMTTLVGVALNLLSAGLAWWTAAQPARRAETARPPTPAVDARRSTKSAARGASPPAVRAMPRAAMIALGISGCVSLILQVAWTRILALVLGPTTYAFSAMVATFISGIALGSLIGGWLSSRRPSPWLLAATLLVSALAATGAAWWAPAVPLVVADAVAAPEASFATVVRLQSGLVAALMLPMTLAFGVAFPLAVALAASDDVTVSRDVAHVYTANTAGAIAGALAGGFVLVPWLGLQNTVRVAATLAVAGFAIVALMHAGRRMAAAAATLAIAAGSVAVIAFAPPWDRELLSSGAYKYAPYLQGPHRDALLRAGTLLYYREGAAATVSVRSATGSISLAIDGKVDASNAGDMLTQRLLAHLPLLLHPAPRRVAIIGLGSGVTLGSALRHPIEAADVLEISPEVVEASRFFERENHHALADRRSRLIVGDGRSHLALGRRQYDVIISEPSNPWMAGVAALFTREFFEAAHARLAPGGILCQWAHTYDIRAEDLRAIVATFTSVFPDATLWLAGEGDVLLIGSLAPIEHGLAGIRGAWARNGVAADLAGVALHDPETLLTLFTADGVRLTRYAGDAGVERDDRMRLEFSAPRGIYGRTIDDNVAALRQLASSAPMPDAVRRAWSAPSTHRNRGLMHLRAEAFRTAFDDFARALERDPGDAAAVDGLQRAAPGAGRLSDAETILARLHAADARNVPVATGLSRLIASRGDFPAAAEPLGPLFSRTSRDVRAMDQLASIFADAGDGPRLASIVRDLEQVAPESEPALYYAASLHFMANRPAEAIAAAERLRARNGRHARGLNLLGVAYATVGRTDDARGAFEASIAADPREPGAYANLGTFELQAGRVEQAADYFAQALTLDPSSLAAQQGLAQAMAALRRH